MVKAELTDSTTKPLPTQRPWSGGSNSRPKLVTALSWLLTPLKLLKSTLACVVTADATPPPRGAALVVAAWLGRVGRAPRESGVPVVMPCVVLGWSGSATATGASVPAVARVLAALATCEGRKKTRAPAATRAASATTVVRRRVTAREVNRARKRIEEPP